MTTAVSDKEPVKRERGGSKTPRTDVLSSLPSRARTTNDKAAARSRMVKRLRIALPVLALVLVAAFLFNTTRQQADDAFLDPPATGFQNTICGKAGELRRTPGSAG